MNRVAGFARFIWDFVVGDDPQIALCVLLGLLATLVLANNGVTAWWLLPLVVAGVLVLSVSRAAASQRRTRP